MYLGLLPEAGVYRRGRKRKLPGLILIYVTRLADDRAATDGNAETQSAADRLPLNAQTSRRVPLRQNLDLAAGDPNDVAVRRTTTWPRLTTFARGYSHGTASGLNAGCTAAAAAARTDARRRTSRTHLSILPPMHFAAPRLALDSPRQSRP